MTTTAPSTSTPTTALEELQFHDESFQQWESLQKKFREKGADGYYRPGIIAESIDPPVDGYRSIIHIANPYENLTVDQSGKTLGNEDAPLTTVSFLSYASKEEIEGIRDRIVPMPETCEMILALAQAKEMNNIILIEGETALGKTFTVNKFVQLLYGPDVKPLDFYCSGQTDVSELHGMWVPRVQSEEDRERFHAFLDSPNGLTKLSEIVEKSDTRRDLLEEQQMRLLARDLKELARSIGLSSDTDWDFLPGALPQAYQATFNPETRRLEHSDCAGKGFPLHIQEVGLAAPRVVNALLECRGEYGRISDSLQIWRNGGYTIHRGPDTMIIMTTNPSEGDGYQERNELDRALLRGLIPLTFPQGLSPFSTHLAATHYFTYQIGNRPNQTPKGCVLELYNYPDELGQPLARVMSAFHLSYIKAMEKGDGRGASTAMIPSIDQLARVADYILRFQVRNSSGNLDIVTTLERAVERIYLRGIKNVSKAQDLRNQLKLLLDGDKLLSGFPGMNRTPRQQLEHAVEEIGRTDPKRGYSPSLINELRTARMNRYQKQNEALRSDLMGNKQVSNAVKRLLRK